MSEALVGRRDINNILRDIIAQHPDWQPSAVARVAFVQLSPAERDDALMILLENQVTKVYALDRATVWGAATDFVPERTNSVAAIRDSGIDPVEADKKLGRLSPIAHRVWARAEARGITREEARAQLNAEDNEYWERQRQKMAKAVKEVAEMERMANIRHLLDRRVMVRGTYKMLLDCTLDEVEWLAKNATDMALGSMHSAAFYTNIANRMNESGAKTVADIDTQGVAA